MILVTGATGNVGRHVVEQLVEAGEQVRAMTRRPERAGLPDSVEVVRGDLAEPESLPAALRGTDRVFLFPMPGRLPGFLDAAKGFGLQRVVLLSASAVTYETPNPIGRMHEECEAAVTGSGLPWTILRPGAFMANDLHWAASIKATGVVHGLDDGAAGAPIDERDIAAVAVRALLDDGHAGEAYLLTGPEALTEPERVGIIGRVLGRDLRFQALSVEEARAGMLTRMPAEVVDSMLAMRAEAREMARVAPAARNLIGRAPYTYAEWATYHVNDFR
ncbi:SDR family oxidoreductase [Microbispora siamensis]|uniref:Nucleotide-diphosphate-sugar epimerase n=1 Tax=Microbispora siamensis TaxID=564413 RepID=A0ABQ4H1W4_9ACTN|nr:SDR family oxidoreductase [Microbispora siamensis]GIH67667.1 nucleotide-diphosphate-sugar epimerase [Microbispora siamensis]